MRDKYEPGDPMWVTETAEAACDGDRWAAYYLDIFRYLDQMGRLADGNGNVVFHNTLAASDYGLTGENLLYSDVSLNGKQLDAADNGTLPSMDPAHPDGNIELPPTSVAFVVTDGSRDVCSR